jgi:hypothetical protein
LKKHDFRLQLRIANNVYRSVVDELPALMELAKRSRERIDAATGMSGSGASQIWATRVATDEATLLQLQAMVPAEGVPDTLPLKQLESLIAAAHGLQLRADKLKGDYLSAIAADDTRRATLAEDHRVLTAARLAEPLKTKLGG